MRSTASSGIRENVERVYIQSTAAWDTNQTTLNDIKIRAALFSCGCASLTPGPGLLSTGGADYTAHHKSVILKGKKRNITSRSFS